MSADTGPQTAAKSRTELLQEGLVLLGWDADTAADWIAAVRHEAVEGLASPADTGLATTAGRAFIERHGTAKTQEVRAIEAEAAKEARTAALARLRTAVEGLPLDRGDETWGTVDRAAVLALLDTEAIGEP